MEIGQLFEVCFQNFYLSSLVEFDKYKNTI